MLRKAFGGLWKPKNPHSLDHLKYLYSVLSKNQVVTESNKGLLVETLRAIAGIVSQAKMFISPLLLSQKSSFGEIRMTARSLTSSWSATCSASS